MRINNMGPGHDDLGTAAWQLLPRLQRACRCRLERAGTSDAAALDDLCGFSEDAAADLTRRATQLVMVPRPWSQSELMFLLWKVLSQLPVHLRNRPFGLARGLDPDLEALVPLSFVNESTPNLRVVSYIDPGRDAAKSYISLLSHWQAVSNLQPGEAPARSIRSAGSVTRAARETRRSMLYDPPEVSRAAIGAFAATWLGRRPTAKTIEHVGEAILFADLDDEHDNATVKHQLQEDAKTQMTRTRLLTEAPFRGQRVGSLDQVPRHDALQGALVGSSMPQRPDVEVERRLEAFDDRVHRVLAQLRPDELQVAQAWARDDTLTWLEAAASCGRAAAFGTRVQRKLRRLGEQLLARTASRSQPALAPLRSVPAFNASSDTLPAPPRRRVPRDSGYRPGSTRRRSA
ncbi:hypothetical protein [Amycolatopsis sp. Hca4]|uniref:hypothetical protein n=1 Tax=Amycolatopsis sp. Hca4 TaxID=2742131 RepID=UPI0015900BF9|nr:hypothetical protein [Amycolatopsis sp. Hca4]QKV74094.1 hypothetical protein HUT10_10170 [Amycolatopsis sp. Hca4]